MATKNDSKQDLDYKKIAKRVFEKRQRRITNYRPENDDNISSIEKYLKKYPGNRNR
ncbi:hypothetical protein [Pontibacillus yanchengensis]|uniref:hypothetical protein n=1 Tax=Pontibacillus yanchengensis TaxID=462910 RepID=UPI000A7A8656|nr:hypothetical protein [Pontibacillus yanchengensis]